MLVSSQLKTVLELALLTKQGRVDAYELTTAAAASIEQAVHMVLPLVLHCCQHFCDTHGELGLESAGGALTLNEVSVP